MTYYQFVQAVEKKVKERIGAKVSVSVYTAEKLNGVVKNGLIISNANVNVSPTIYLEEYYQEYEEGESLEEIVENILELYEEVRYEKSWEEDRLHNYCNIRNQIVYRVVHYKKNEKLLQTVPHLQYLDLAILFYVLVEKTSCSTATMLIRKEHLSMWKVSEEEICNRAFENTERLLPYEFHTMSSMLAELTGPVLVPEEECMYVLSNSIRSYGAAVILYKERLKYIGEYLKENYYLLPSSVHEVIIIPESYAVSKESFNRMIREINETQVLEEEVLSDHAYYYNRQTHTLEM